VVTAETETKI